MVEATAEEEGAPRPGSNKTPAARQGQRCGREKCNVFPPKDVWVITQYPCRVFPMDCARKGKKPIFPGRKVDFSRLVPLNGPDNMAGNLRKFISIMNRYLAD